MQDQLNRQLLVQAERDAVEVCRALIVATTSFDGSRRPPIQPHAGDWMVGGAWTVLHLACVSKIVEKRRTCCGGKLGRTCRRGTAPPDLALQSTTVEYEWSGGGGSTTFATVALNAVECRSLWSFNFM